VVQTSSKSKNTIIAVAIIVVLAVSLVGAVFYLLTYDNVMVSGEAGVTSFLASTVRTIEFQDTQTGTTTTFHFTFAANSYTGVGNYSVTLKNGHTYNVYLSFSFIAPGNVRNEFITTFTINVAAGQTAITKNFDYPNFG
jgi:hypothetical protein